MVIENGTVRHSAYEFLSVIITMAVSFIVCGMMRHIGRKTPIVHIILPFNLYLTHLEPLRISVATSQTFATGQTRHLVSCRVLHPRFTI